MATTYEAKSYKNPALDFPLQVMERVSVAEEFGTSTALVTNDVIKFFKLPVGAKLLGGHIESEDLDTDATPAITLSLIVTNGTTTKTLIDGGTVGQGGGIVFAESDATGAAQTGWKGYVCNGDGWYVAVKVKLQADAAQAGDIQAGIRYTKNTEGGERNDP